MFLRPEFRKRLKLVMNVPVRIIGRRENFENLEPEARLAVSIPILLELSNGMVAQCKLCLCAIEHRPCVWAHAEKGSVTGQMYDPVVSSCT